MIFSRKSSRPSSKGKPSKLNRPETPFETRRRELAEQEESLRAAEEKHRRFIEDAPKLAAERRREERELYLKNARTAQTHSSNPHRLPDERYLNNDVPAANSSSKRRDREKGKWTFFLLLLLLAMTAFWMFQTLWHPSF